MNVMNIFIGICGAITFAVGHWMCFAAADSKSSDRFSCLKKLDEHFEGTSPLNIIDQNVQQNAINCFIQCSQLPLCKFLTIYGMNDGQSLCQFVQTAPTVTAVESLSHSSAIDIYQLDRSCNNALSHSIIAWSAWSTWTKCNATCGHGAKTRVRFCTSCNITSMIALKKEYIDCDSGPCRSKRQSGYMQNFGQPQYNQGFGAGQYPQDRNNFGYNSQGFQQTGRLQNLETGCPPCSCESGRQLVQPTAQLQQNIRPQVSQPRQQFFQSSGQWYPWEPWQQCSVTCGSGTRSRRRQCGGSPGTCRGQDYVQTTCYTECPRSQWGPWEPWSSCSVSCGPGRRSRNRICRGVTLDCVGNSLETGQCNSPCPLSQWSFWEPWGQCSVSCGVGTRSRRRTCSNAGGPCPGQAFATETCGTTCREPQWSGWQPWERCSVSCGNGVKFRSRQCYDPSGFPSSSCTGSDRDTGTCFSQPCPVAQWLPWEPWSECSVSCGSGGRTRRRQCSNPVLQCPGISSESGTCNVFCRPDNWIQWNSWQQCSVSCGQGTRIRTRSCTGSRCPGDSRAIEPCFPGQCITASWAQWEQWQQCSVSCGQGIQTRTRRCIGLGNCPGGQPASRETSQCGSPFSCNQLFSQGSQYNQINGYGQDTATWIEWGPWGICVPLRGSCGVGTRQRRRMCLGGLENECESIWRNQGVEDRACDVTCFNKSRKESNKIVHDQTE